MGEKQLYITKGVMDEAFIRSASAQIANPPYVRVFRNVVLVIAAAAMAAMLITGIVTGYWEITLPAILRIALICGGYALFVHWMHKWSANLTVKRFAEENPGCQADYVVAADDCGVHVHNAVSGAKVAFPYDRFRRVIFMGDNWVLLTKTNAFIPFFAAQLTQTERKSVLELFKQNHPKVKIQIKEKV